MSVQAGTTVALVGSSGAGKSTAAALLERFYECDRGSVLLEGVSIQDIDSAHLHRALGLVSQEPVLLARSIRDNICLSVDSATEEEVSAAAVSANASVFIEAYADRYGTMVGERGVTLSGGQKQRIALARALLSKPALLILDEATSALDAESESLVVAALERARVGRTVFIIAHRLSTIRDADNICVADAGRVAESGTHSELIAEDGVYARLVNRQLAASSEGNLVELQDTAG